LSASNPSAAAAKSLLPAVTATTSRRRRRKQGPYRAGLFLLALGLFAPTPASAAAPPLVLRYEAYALGLPVLVFDFRLDEGEADYDASGAIRAVGVLRLFASFTMRTESQGAIAADQLLPRKHETASRTRGKDRLAHLDYPGDGSVAAVIAPPDDSGRPKPTVQQIAGTIDPLSAILAIGHNVARAGHCADTVAIYDGRRRYDMTLVDRGVERLEPSSRYGYAGEVRRCDVSVVKIAGFSFDQDYSPHTERGRVWLASPRPGTPPLPVRVEFDSDWGAISVRMTAIDPPKADAVPPAGR
jgi:hypothetical protein